MADMQLVRFRQNVAAPEGSYSAGQLAMLVPELAARWEEQGLIEKVKLAQQPETAAVEPPERAVKPRPRSRRGR